jgi:hypothetical protein
MNILYFFLFFTHILLGILIFKGVTARPLYKSFGVKGLIIRSARVKHARDVRSLPTPTSYVLSNILKSQSFFVTSPFNERFGTDGHLCFH